MELLAEVLSNGITQTVVGGLIAGVAGLIALGVGRRNEHRKWLREQRVEAYVGFLSQVDELVFLKNQVQVESGRTLERVDRFQALSRKVADLRAEGADAVPGDVEDATKELERLGSESQRAIEEAEARGLRLDELQRESHSLMSSVELLGPNHLGALVNRLQAHVLKDDRQGLSEARSDFVREARSILAASK